MEFTDYVTIHHPTEDIRALIEYTYTVSDYDDRTNSGTAVLEDFTVLDILDNDQDRNSDDDSWINEQLVRSAANIR